jgi:hypothetical protein
MDVTLYIESIFKNNRRHMMKMDHRRVIWFDEDSVPESTAIQQEYDHLVIGDEEMRENDKDDESNAEDGLGEPAFVAQSVPVSHRHLIDQHEEPQNPATKRQKLTMAGPPSLMNQWPDSAHRLSDMASNAVVQSAGLSADRAMERGRSASRASSGSGGLASRPLRTTRNSNLRASSPYSNQSVNSFTSHESEVRAQCHHSLQYENP